MKKLFYSISVLVMTIMSAMTFTSCEDVPAPYDTPDGIANDGVYINESFATTLGSFKAYTTHDSVKWHNDFSSAVVSGSVYDEKTKKRTIYAATAWLVSPSIDLSKEDSVAVMFSHAIAYADAATMLENHQLLISHDYVQGSDPATATWTPLNIKIEGDHTGKNYDFGSAGVNLEKEQMKENTTFALRYISTDKKASTWEVKNFIVMHGSYKKPEPITPTPNEDIMNIDFTQGQGDWTIDNVSLPEGLTYVWSNGNQYGMKASAYKDKKNYASESWLVSPEIDLTNINGDIELNFNQCINKYFGDVSKEATLWVKEIGKDWNNIQITYPTLKDNGWSDFEIQKVNISAYAGKKIQIGFKYSSTENTSGTWEIKSVTVKQGETAGEVIDADAFVVEMSSLGFKNQEELKEVTLSNGTVLTFGDGGGANTPKYYDSGKAARLYSKNTMNIKSAGKNIQKVVITCAAPNGETLYNGNEKLYGKASEIQITPEKKEKTTVIFSNFDSNELFIMNDHTDTKGGTQLRIVKLAITYAK